MQTKTTGDAKNDKRPKQESVKGNPVDDDPHPPMRSCDCDECDRYFYQGCREGWYD